ncbi:MAG: hypothetical protein J0I12_28835 [Candidatus Eremiobacteraeota bacterium]|nr:hypothetical protein [Candidatus Eremiobacteraeota bacterium]
MKEPPRTQLELRMADPNGRARVADMMALINDILFQGGPVDASASFKTIPLKKLEDGDV